VSVLAICGIVCPKLTLRETSNRNPPVSMTIRLSLSLYVGGAKTKCLTAGDLPFANAQCIRLRDEFAGGATNQEAGDDQANTADTSVHSQFFTSLSQRSR
jgi:hypothetical protein